MSIYRKSINTLSKKLCEVTLLSTIPFLIFHLVPHLGSSVLVSLRIGSAFVHLCASLELVVNNPGASLQLRCSCIFSLITVSLSSLLYPTCIDMHVFHPNYLPNAFCSF